MLMWASMILIGIAVFIITSTFFQDEEQYKASEKLEEGSEGKEDLAKYGIVLRYSRPFFKRYITPVVSGMKGRNKIRDKYKQKIAAGGMQKIMSPDDFFSFKLFLIIGFPALFLATRIFLEEDWPLKYTLVAAVGGYFYPDIWIKGVIERRQKEVMLAMPFVVDMLALSVEAGLDFIAAMSKVVEKAKPSPLNDEFELVIREIKIGASRAEALRNMSWRVDLLPIASFTATLIAADSVGANIGPILKALSAEIRQKRSADVEKAGATAATKILLPMIFLIVPAVMLIVMTPMVSGFFSGD